VGLSLRRTGTRPARQIHPQTSRIFINNIINARQVMCRGSEERQREKTEEEKTTNRLNSCLAGRSKVHRHRLTCFESSELVEMFTRQAAGGRARRASLDLTSGFFLLTLLRVPRIQMIFSSFFSSSLSLSNVGLLTRIMMKQIQRNIGT